MIYDVEIEGRTHRVEIERTRGGWWISVDGAVAERVSGHRLGPAEWRLALPGGRTRSVGVSVDGPQAALQIGGHGLAARVVDPRRRGLDAVGGGASGTVVTPMPGVVARVLVAVGDPVVRDQVLVVVEAMKMENEYRAPIDGIVAEVHVAAGRAVEAHAPLARVVEPR